MRIAIFTDSFFPYISGVTTAISNRAEGLIERGHEVEVFRPKPTEPDSGSVPVGGLTVYDLPISVPSGRVDGLGIQLPLFIPAYRAVRKFKPDIFHVDTQWGVGWQGVLSAKVSKKPLVSTFHTFWTDSEYLKYFPFSNAKSKKRLMWKYILFFHNQFDVVCSPSELVEERLIEKGLEAETTVIPNCIKEVKLKSDELMREKRGEYGLTGAPNLIFVGRVSHEKSLNKVIEAFRNIVHDFPDSKLLIIGDGDAKEDLEDLVEETELNGQVRFLGRIPNEKLLEENLFRLGDVFVTASRTENHPVSLLEAQAFGLPVVAPSAAGIPEVVTNREDGLLYPPETENEVKELTDLLAELLESEDKREKMSKNAIENSKNHTASKVAGRLEDLYERVIQSKG